MIRLMRCGLSVLVNSFLQRMVFQRQSLAGSEAIYKERGCSGSCLFLPMDVRFHVEFENLAGMVDSMVFCGIFFHVKAVSFPMH